MPPNIIYAHICTDGLCEELSGTVFPLRLQSASWINSPGGLWTEIYPSNTGSNLSTSCDENKVSCENEVFCRVICRICKLGMYGCLDIKLIANTWLTRHIHFLRVNCKVQLKKGFLVTNNYL